MAVIQIAGEDVLAAGVERELRARGVGTSRLHRAAHELERGDIAEATTLVLAANDDAGNVSLALRARHMEPTLPIVVRIFDAALALYLTQTLDGVRVLSMSGVTAPHFVEAAAKATAGAASMAPLQVFMPREIRRRRFRIDPVLVAAVAAFFLLVFPSAFYFANAPGHPLPRRALFRVDHGDDRRLRRLFPQGRQRLLEGLRHGADARRGELHRGALRDPFGLGALPSAST
jgi:hypothetical protein